MEYRCLEAVLNNRTVDEEPRAFPSFLTRSYLWGIFRWSLPKNSRMPLQTFRKLFRKQSCGCLRWNLHPFRKLFRKRSCRFQASKGKGRTVTSMQNGGLGCSTRSAQAAIKGFKSFLHSGVATGSRTIVITFQNHLNNQRSFPSREKLKAGGWEF
jgi:hypothetical protein